MDTLEKIRPSIQNDLNRGFSNYRIPGNNETDLFTFQSTDVTYLTLRKILIKAFYQKANYVLTAFGDSVVNNTIFTVTIGLSPGFHTFGIPQQRGVRHMSFGSFRVPHRKF